MALDGKGDWDIAGIGYTKYMCWLSAKTNSCWQAQSP